MENRDVMRQINEKEMETAHWFVIKDLKFIHSLLVLSNRQGSAGSMSLHQ